VTEFFDSLAGRDGSNGNAPGGTGVESSAEGKGSKNKTTN
jgi:hypothetical protein